MLMLRTIAAVSLAVLLISAVGNGQSPSAKFSEAKGLPTEAFEPSRFEFSIGVSKYIISDKGKGSVKTEKTRRQVFDLRVPRYERLVRLQHTEYDKDLLLIGELTDGEYGYGFVARLNSKTLKTKWKRSIVGFNVGQGLIDEGHVYVTGIGFIGKINVESGTYVWKHRDLYARSGKAFNSFELPEIKGDTVIFRESPDPYRKKVASIIVDRRTGRILKLDS